MKDNNYGKVEGMLYSVPKLKVEIENLIIDKEEVMEVQALRGASDNEKAGSSTNAFSSSVENEVIHRDEHLDEKISSINKAIRYRERQLKRIENAMNLLTEGEKLLIELRYFKRYSVDRVCEILDITTETFHLRRKKIIIKHLIPLFCT